MKNLTAAIVICSCAACGSTSDQVRQARLDERDYRRFDWELRYRDYARRCQDAGGHMLLRSGSRAGRPGGLPRRGDLFACSRGVGTPPRD